MFKRPFINWRYFLVWIGDAIVVSISIYLAILIYNFLGPIIGKDPLSEKTIEYLSGFLWKIIVFYTIPLYITGIIERLMDERSGVKGHILIAFTALFGVACMVYWIRRGLSIKTFSVFFLISLLAGTSLWRLKVLPLFIERKEKVLSRIPSRIQDYFREKPSAPFIIGFMVFLILSAFLLILKRQASAESTANWAYLMLVIGLIIEFIQFIRNNGKADRNGEGD